MIKDLLPKQVVCNEKNDKGKPCHGKLKRYYPFAGYYNEPNLKLQGEIKQQYGEDPKLILLKCEECQMVFRLPEVLKQKFNQ